MENKDLTERKDAPAAEKPADAGKKTSPIRMIARIAVLLALLSFCLPFVLVSCNGSTEYSQSYSGMRLMTGKESKNDNMASQRDSDGKVNVFLIAAFGSTAVAGVTLLIIKKKDVRLLTAGLNAFSLLMMLIFRLSFRAYYDLNKVDKETGLDASQMINVETKFGFKLCVFFLIVAALFCLIDNTGVEKKTDGTTG
ncbi:MAG: hypothetical protein J5501_11210 [Ruminococcus sp.]|nr:hypothetical protein [Ruminococcus sp.]